MADSNAPSATIESNSQQPDSGAPPSQLDPVPASQPYAAQQPSSAPPSAPAVPNANPNANPQVLSTPTQPATNFLYAPSQAPGGPVVPPAAPSFRPVPQFSPLPSLNYQNPSLQPPGVGSASPMAPGVAISGAGAAPMSQHQVQPAMAYQVQMGQPPNPAMRPFAPVPNGYAAIPAGPQGAMNPMGLPRYPAPYGTVVRPIYHPRPLGTTGVLPTMSRPPIVPVPPVRPVISPAVRPVAAPSVTAEKPQTTVYVGKIAPTVENDFILSLLQLCGPVKNWKRAQNPSDGTHKGFGFCEFESAEGVLRALRLLSKFKIDGQELVLNVNQATREYLERYVEKKTEDFKKLKETPGAGDSKSDESANTVSNDSGKPPLVEDAKKEGDNSTNKEIHDSSNFGVVTDEDREADQVALDKLTNMIEERLKTKPLPPPPPPSQAIVDAAGNSNSEAPAQSREGESDTFKIGEDKNEEEANSDNKPTSENDRRESSSPDRSRRNDRRSRERDRERDLKREKEREIEKYEREAERERYRKEREQRRKMEEAERYYEECLKEWEYREKDKEKQRQYEKERDKERERKRKKEILNDEDDEGDDSRKRWRKSVLEEKRKKRLHEKEDDLTDRQKEEQEIAEAKRKAEEEQKHQQHKDMFKLSTEHLLNGGEKSVMTLEVSSENKDKAIDNNTVDANHDSHMGDANLVNGINDESTMASDGATDGRQSGIVPAKKLGFGLVGSGKRTAVPSVFHEDDDDDAEKDKKMRPLVPIDYSTEELQAVQPSASGSAPQNLAMAASESAKRISIANLKEEKRETDRDRNRHSNEKRDRERTDDNSARSRDEIKERSTERDKAREHGLDKAKTSDNKKLLDAKQLIDMIPKTKEELFSFNINWAVYDKNQLHERMRPWISRKITEFLGEEETTLVDYIVSSTQEHVKASQMLELLQSILDEEAEMFVLKMWRMLIFEIMKVETGLATRSK